MEMHPLLIPITSIGQDNIEKKIWGFSFDLHNPVFVLSGLVIIAIVAFALIAPGTSKSFFDWLRPAITSTFDWFFLTAANIFLIVCVVLIFTPLAKVRIGGTEGKARLFLRKLVSDAVCSGHGHWPDVFWGV